MGQPQFLADTTVGTGWTYFSFGFNPQNLISIAADRANTDTILISDDGVNTRYRLNSGEPYTFLSRVIRGLYIQANSGTQAFRLSAT